MIKDFDRFFGNEKMLASSKLKGRLEENFDEINVHLNKHHVVSLKNNSFRPFWEKKTV